MPEAACPDPLWGHLGRILARELDPEHEIHLPETQSNTWAVLVGESGGRGIRSNPMSLTPLPPDSPANWIADPKETLAI